MKCHVLLLLLAVLVNAYGQSKNSVTNAPTSSNGVQVVSGGTEAERSPAVAVGPFMFNGGHEAKKQESESVWISILNTLIWPVVVVLIVWFFNRDIRSFLGRLTSVKAKDYGVDLTPSEKLSDQQKVSANTSISPLTPPQTATGAGTGEIQFEKAKANQRVTPAMEQIIAAVTESAKKSPFTTEQQMELGIIGLARVVLNAEFWRIYNFIFGSQLHLLQFVNTRPVSPAELEVFFANVKQQFPDTYKSSNAQEYIHYLLTNGLIAQNDGNYVYAPKGREFLHWCIENNLGFNKPL